jgi:hypothetical protein
MDSTNSNATKLQSIYRGYIYRKTYLRFLKSAIIIQYQFRKKRKRFISKNTTAAVVDVRTSISSSSTSSIEDIKIRLKDRLAQVRQNNSQLRERTTNIRSVIKKRLPNAVSSSKDSTSSLREESMYGTMIESMMQSKSQELDEDVLSLDSMDIAYQMHMDSDKRAMLGKFRK